MKSAAKKSTLSVMAKLEFTVTPASFQPSANLDLLDPAKFGKRRVRLEVGEFTGGCCTTKLYADIENGKVSRLKMSKCKEAARPPAQLAEVLSKAIAATGLDRPGSVIGMPVAEFIARARRRFIDIDWGGGCIYVCVFDFCFYCCVLDGDTLCGRPIVVTG
jgi:hypothetical protein